MRSITHDLIVNSVDARVGRGGKVGAVSAVVQAVLHHTALDAAPVDEHLRLAGIGQSGSGRGCGVLRVWFLSGRFAAVALDLQHDGAALNSGCVCVIVGDNVVGKSGVAPDARDDLHRRARSRFRLRGHADGAAQTARADGDGLAFAQIHIVRLSARRIVRDVDIAGHGERAAVHKHAAAFFGGCIVGDAAAAHGKFAVCVNAATVAISSIVAGDLAAVHIEFTELANVYASVGVAGDGAAKHIQRAEAEYIYAAVAAAFDRTAAHAVGQGQMRVFAKDLDHVIKRRIAVRAVDGMTVEAELDITADQDSRAAEGQVIFQIIAARRKDIALA